MKYLRSIDMADVVWRRNCCGVDCNCLFEKRARLGELVALLVQKPHLQYHITLLFDEFKIHCTDMHERDVVEGQQLQVARTDRLVLIVRQRECGWWQLAVALIENNVSSSDNLALEVNKTSWKEFKDYVFD